MYVFVVIRKYQDTYVRTYVYTVQVMSIQSVYMCRSCPCACAVQQNAHALQIDVVMTIIRIHTYVACDFMLIMFNYTCTLQSNIMSTVMKVYHVRMCWLVRHLTVACTDSVSITKLCDTLHAILYCVAVHHAGM